MLPAAARLRRSRDFRATLRQGRRAGSPGRLVVLHLRAAVVGAGDAGDREPARAGIVVPRSVGGAVVRTTVKRRLRHVLRARLANLAPGSALVVRALPPAAGATSAELDADLGAALNRVLRQGPSR